ncbi:MAG: NADH:ubiquinone reductase (Na(+)-transporting) subunit C [Bacteroidales bacterium]|jgi:Na+-transporting NADH:ubiquinone oxidoreductase subunit C|nr:NADH:ubiquinone reductase (Na(+)-transporting) subunit C [Bacteroidales bacterium]MCI2121481.1 NADH:ubiquinone reductase (Na(+)-transporting) subunit C [Bacteroidales bacterium]MCI2145278.1 NADH:ubiquinone reductase (Na(+)-transporting) subunit C [Bacteroidales bacterium]
MKINTESNLYTFVYSVVLVVVVAAVLAFTYSALKPKQDENVALEKMQTILHSANLGMDASKQADKASYIKGLYADHIVSAFVLNSDGDTVPGKDAFKVNLKAQYDVIKKMEATKDSGDRKVLEAKLLLPVFVCNTSDAGNVDIYPCYGAGLWGPIWGYIAVEQDCNTIYGAVFDDESETPGLGAEIATDRFSGQFKGKQLYKDGTFVSVAIVKGGGQASNPNGVDAISGGTITSRSLETTIRQWLSEYLNYFNVKLGASGEGASLGKGGIQNE